MVEERGIMILPIVAMAGMEVMHHMLNGLQEQELVLVVAIQVEHQVSVIMALVDQVIVMRVIFLHVAVPTEVIVEQVQ